VSTDDLSDAVLDAEPFELRDIDGGDLLGIFMGTHAVPGAIMLLHTTVGCKFKTQLQISDHDWGRESHNQRLWTGVDDARIIKGSGPRLVEFATTWYQRRKPDVFIVTTNASVELSSFDVEAAVNELRMRLPIPVLYLKAPGHTGSPFSGYRRLLQAMTPLLDQPGPDSSDRTVAIGGYFLDRFEMEHAANVSELRRLLGACGLECRGVLFDGSPWDRVRKAGTARNVVWLPYGHGIADTACADDGRTHSETDLPVGLTGTSVFIERVGRDLGIDPGVVESVRDRELSRVVPLIKRAVNTLAGQRVAVFLDTAAAAAVTSFLTELGCEVPIVFLTDGASASEDAFFAACGRLGATFESDNAENGAVRPSRPRVFAGRSRNTEYVEFMKECRNGFIPVVIGSSIQTAAFSSGDVRVLELGFPSVNKHWLYPMPWMGYNGAVALVQRLLDTFKRAH